MAKTRVKLHYKGFRALRNAPGVQAELQRHAGNMAAEAGAGHDHDSRTGRERARATVWTSSNAARRAESRDFNLTRTARRRG